MHISEGVLSLPVLTVGASMAAAGLYVGLRRLPWQQMMSVSVLSSAFFIASLIHIPLGPGSVHLILNGLMGAILGWAAIPAIAVALFLQALLFQFGGLTTLGVNICIMSFPAVFSGVVLRRWFHSNKTRPVAAFLCGFFSVLLSAVLCSLALAFSGEAFLMSAKLIVLAHVPVMVIEGLLSAVIVSFIAKSSPELLAFDVARTDSV